MALAQVVQLIMAQDLKEKELETNKTLKLLELQTEKEMQDKAIAARFLDDQLTQATRARDSYETTLKDIYNISPEYQTTGSNEITDAHKQLLDNDLTGIKSLLQDIQNETDILKDIKSQVIRGENLLQDNLQNYRGLLSTLQPHEFEKFVQDFQYDPDDEGPQSKRRLSEYEIAGAKKYFKEISPPDKIDAMLDRDLQARLITSGLEEQAKGSYASIIGSIGLTDDADENEAKLLALANSALENPGFMDRNPGMTKGEITSAISEIINFSGQSGGNVENFMGMITAYPGRSGELVRNVLASHPSFTHAYSNLVESYTKIGKLREERSGISPENRLDVFSLNLEELNTKDEIFKYFEENTSGLDETATKEMFKLVEDKLLGENASQEDRENLGKEYVKDHLNIQAGIDIEDIKEMDKKVVRDVFSHEVNGEYVFLNEVDGTLDAEKIYNFINFDQFLSMNTDDAIDFTNTLIGNVDITRQATGLASPMFQRPLIGGSFYGGRTMQNKLDVATTGMEGTGFLTASLMGAGSLGMGADVTPWAIQRTYFTKLRGIPNSKVGNFLFASEQSFGSSVAGFEMMGSREKIEASGMPSYYKAYYGYLMDKLNSAEEWEGTLMPGSKAWNVYEIESRLEQIANNPNSNLSKEEFVQFQKEADRLGKNAVISDIRKLIEDNPDLDNPDENMMNLIKILKLSMQYRDEGKIFDIAKDRTTFTGERNRLGFPEVNIIEGYYGGGSGETQFLGSGDYRETFGAGGTGGLTVPLNVVGSAISEATGVEFFEDWIPGADFGLAQLNRIVGLESALDHLSNISKIEIEE